MNASAGKLIRDAVPQVIEAQGLTPVLRVAEPGEYRQLLIAKLHEEAAEVEQALTGAADIPDTNTVAGELADVLEVLFAIATDISISSAQVEQARSAKQPNAAASRGAWSGRAISAAPRQNCKRLAMPGIIGLLVTSRLG